MHIVHVQCLLYTWLYMYLYHANYQHIAPQFHTYPVLLSANTYAFIPHFVGFLGRYRIKASLPWTPPLPHLSTAHDEMCMIAGSRQWEGWRKNEVWRVDHGLAAPLVRTFRCQPDEKTSWSGWIGHASLPKKTCVYTCLYMLYSIYFFPLYTPSLPLSI